MMQNHDHDQQDEDTNLPAARENLHDAIHQLIEPTPQLINNTTHWQDSLYDQLTDEIPGSQGNATHIPQSSPPICIDAAQLKHEIDTAIAAWEPRPPLDANQNQPPPITILRLQTIQKRRWRPQDVHGIQQITNNIQSWCENIRNILNPQPHWHLPNPCPACDTAIIYRKNSSGENTRQPALQIGPTGCVCQNCHHAWTPEYFQHLAKVLGYQLPDGVLE